MCWLSIVVRSPPARGSLSWIQSLLIDLWLLVNEVSTLSLILTNYPDHGHHGDPPPTRKIPMVEPGIEPGASWLVVRSSDHQTTRLVLIMYEVKITPLKMHDVKAIGKGESSEGWLLNQNSAQLWQNRRLDRVYMEIKSPTRCNRWFFIAKLIVR